MDERATFPREYTVSRGVPIIKRVYLSCPSEADIAPAGHITLLLVFFCSFTRGNEHYAQFCTFV